MMKVNLFHWAAATSLLVVLVACGGEPIKPAETPLKPVKVEEPIANAKKPTREAAREYCLQKAAPSETVDQCVERILGL